MLALQEHPRQAPCADNGRGILELPLHKEDIRDLLRAQVPFCNGCMHHDICLSTGTAHTHNLLCASVLSHNVFGPTAGSAMALCR